jgi:RNA polymerase sigma-70 factor (subfamily 1)
MITHPASNADFETLLTDARTGNGTALGRLLECARPQLERYAASALAARPRLRGRDADLVQETLKDAVVGFERFLGVSEPGWHQWLKRILENNVTDLCRYDGAAKRDAAKEERLDTPRLRTLPDGGETPSKVVSRDEDIERLRRAFRQLSPDQQAVIRLRDTERLPFAEIARRMGKPSDEAARKHYERARARLKEVFDDAGSA